MSTFQAKAIRKYKKEITWLLREKYNLELPPDVILRSPKETEESSIKSWILCFAQDDVKAKILGDFNRIVSKEPIDYVIGFKEFLGCKIDLSQKPLIPRPETEYWVEKMLNRYLLPVTRFEHSQPSTVHGSRLTILDLCCGSGCIGISILKHVPWSHVTFADISQKALEQTKLNLSINRGPTSFEVGPQKVVKIIQSDLFKNLKGKNFDYIFCNPPYVPPKEIKGSLLYEPKIALDGKKGGLEIIYRILSEFQNHLNPGGKLFLEFGYGQKSKIEMKIREIRNEIKETEKLNYEFKKDQYGKYRYLIVGI